MVNHGYRFYVLPEVLYQLRALPKSVSKYKSQKTYAAIARQSVKRGEKWINVQLSNCEADQNLTKQQEEVLYHYAIGVWKLEEGYAKTARNEFRKALSSDPVDIRLWYWMILSFLPTRTRKFIFRGIQQTMDNLSNVSINAHQLLRRKGGNV